MVERDLAEQVQSEIQNSQWIVLSSRAWWKPVAGATWMTHREFWLKMGCEWIQLRPHFSLRWTDHRATNCEALILLSHVIRECSCNWDSPWFCFYWRGGYRIQFNKQFSTWVTPAEWQREAFSPHFSLFFTSLQFPNPVTHSDWRKTKPGFICQQVVITHDSTCCPLLLVHLYDYSRTNGSGKKKKYLEDYSSLNVEALYLSFLSFGWGCSWFSETYSKSWVSEHFSS